MPHSSARPGFTLLEMSIVLVIIALIAAGIVVGKSLVEVANMRSVVNQINRYKVAVKSFQLKYGALPGDMLPNEAVARGLPVRTRGNGNGLITPDLNAHTTPVWPISQSGETNLFWGDLSFTGLSDGGYKGLDCSYGGGDCATTNAFTYFPKARFGKDKGITVYGDTAAFGNYFVLLGNLSGITNQGHLTTTYAPLSIGSANATYAALTPLQAFNIDTKMDEGSPLTGGLTVLPANIYVNYFSNVYLPLPMDTPSVPAVGVCVSNAAGNPYNSDSNLGGSTTSCVLRFAIQ